MLIHKTKLMIFKGDYGGGLYQNNIVIGILSSGYIEAEIEFTGYTRVNHHIYWILSTVCNEAKDAQSCEELKSQNGINTAAYSIF